MSSHSRKNSSEKGKSFQLEGDSFLIEPFQIGEGGESAQERTNTPRMRAFFLVRQLMRHPLVPEEFAQVFLPSLHKKHSQEEVCGEEPDDDLSEEFGLNKKSAQEIRDLLSQPGEPSQREAIRRLEALQAVLAKLHF